MHKTIPSKKIPRISLTESSYISKLIKTKTKIQNPSRNVSMFSYFTIRLSFALVLTVYAKLTSFHKCTQHTHMPSVNIINISTFLCCSIATSHCTLYELMLSYVELQLMFIQMEMQNKHANVSRKKVYDKKKQILFKLLHCPFSGK